MAVTYESVTLIVYFDRVYVHRSETETESEARDSGDKDTCCTTRNRKTEEAGDRER